MSCTVNAKVHFPLTDFTIRPYSLKIRVDNGEFDLAEGKFSKEVGEYMEPYIQDEGASLRVPQPVEIHLEGQKSHYLYFRPEYVTLGETNTFIEFHDPLKHFKYHIIDFNLDKSSAKASYKKIFNRVYEENLDEIFKGIKFSISKNAKTQKSEDSRFVVAPDILSPATDFLGAVDEAHEDLGEGIASWVTDYDEEPDMEKSTVLDTKFEFDIKNANALEALQHINKQLGMTMFTDSEGILHIGDKMTDQNYHVAADKDNRVWTYGETNIQPPENPIRLVVVKGGMVDAPNSKTNENFIESSMEFINPSESHEKDLIAQGIAQRTNLNYGKVVSTEAEKVSRDGLADRAVEVMKEQMRQNSSGTVDINVNNSGQRVSDYSTVRPGDVILLVPPEGNCKTFKRDAYYITGLEHDINGSSWNLNLKIKRQVENKDANIDKGFRYFNPDENKYHNEDFEQITAGG